MSGISSQHTDTVSHIITTRRSEQICVCQSCPQRPYVELQVPPHIERVQKLVFRTLSHDQGFSNEQDRLRGTYDQCYSWFEVGILNPSGHLRLPQRMLQENMHAEGQPRWHTNIWDLSEIEDESLQHLLHSICCGDVVQVIPMARFVAWRNYVYEVEMEIHGYSFAQDHNVPPLATRLLQADHNENTLPSSYATYPLKDALSEIRLLVLHPGTIHEPLSGTLIRRSLGSTAIPPFECLSYCWGDLGDTTNIDLLQEGDAEDGLQTATLSLLITANLASALLQLRNANDSRILWIDAICINQDDPKERAEQVTRLRDIFSQARNVVVWLGSTNQAIDEAIRGSEAMMEHYTKHPVLTDQNPHERFFNPHEPLLHGGDGYLSDSPILGFEWFHRAWVLQEVYLARKISVVCGDKILPWALILRINECLNLTMMKALLPVRKNVMPFLFTSLFKLCHDPAALITSAGYQTEEQKLNILDVVIRGLDLETSDPRDKLFALLPFGEDTSMVTSLPPEILPNYTKTDTKVFSDFTRWWIVKNRSLKILSAIHLSQGRTWVRVSTSAKAVEFHGRPSWCIWHDGRSVRSQGTLALNEPFMWNASQGSALDIDAISLPSDPATLNLKGRHIGTVQKIENYPYLNTIRRLRNSSTDAPPQWNDIQDAYESIFDPVNYQGTWTSNIHQGGDANKQSRETRPDIETNLVDHFYAHGGLDGPGVLSCHDPCFFHTKDGLEGLCPYQTKVGDEIVVLNGARVPFILRTIERTEKKETSSSSLDDWATATRYVLVGECYVNGFMQGRALMKQSGQNDEFKEDLFALV